MLDLENKALFDPGFSGVLMHFLPIYQDAIAQISALGNLNQKKFKYRLLSSNVIKSFRSTLGFWRGCIMWGIYLKYKFKDSPKEIEGNSLLDIDEKELSEYMFDEEFNFIENYMKNYPNETKYFLGKPMAFDKKYFEIFDDYKEFAVLNEHFIKTKMTSDIKMPKKYEKEYTEIELKEILNEIINAINNKDLSILIK